MPRTKLNTDEIEVRLAGIEGWKINGAGHLERDFKFKSFPEAVSFMTRIAFEAEALDHHPDWSNSYNRVHIELSTHDAGGLTENDFELARRIEKVNWT